MIPNCAAFLLMWKWPAKLMTKFFSRSKSSFDTLPDSSISTPTSTLQAGKQEDNNNIINNNNNNNNNNRNDNNNNNNK